MSSSFCLRSKHTTSWSAVVAWMETGAGYRRMRISVSSSDRRAVPCPGAGAAGAGRSAAGRRSSTRS